MRVNRSGEPSYAGLPTFRKIELVLDPADLNGADVAIVGAPMDEYVTNRPGARFGPREIRAAYDGGEPNGWHMDLGIDPFESLRVVDHADAAVVPGDPERSHAAIRASVEGILDAGVIPIVLGGDHSIAYPDVTAVAGKLERGSLAVIQFDTHADTATENWGVTRAHGTPFRHLVDDGVIPGSRLVQVGLRGLWPFHEEFEWMRSASVRWHRMDDVIDRGIEAVMIDVLEQIADAEHLFLSVDIDVLDPAFAPGTGTPEPGGMSTRELLHAIRMLTVGRGFVGMELVEVSPPYDHSGITALAAHRIVVEALSGLALNRVGQPPQPETAY